jgi:hypothetical protein
MASCTERVPASFVARPLHSSASDLSWRRASARSGPVLFTESFKETENATARLSSGWIAPACGRRTHLITSSAEQKHLRHGNLKRFGGLEVYDQLQLDRLLHREFTRVGAFKYASRGFVPPYAKSKP